MPHNNLTPFSAEKNGLSLSHLDPEILGPKVSLIFSTKCINSF